MTSPGIRVLLGLQGTFYLLTGVWPLVSIRSFKAVTGEKTDNWTGQNEDHWLVYTVAVLIVSLAVPMLLAAWRGEFGVAIAALAILPAIALTTIDVVFVIRRVILPIYLLDAVIEMVILAAWTFLLLRRPRHA